MKARTPKSKPGKVNDDSLVKEVKTFVASLGEPQDDLSKKLLARLLLTLSSGGAQ